MVDLLLLLTAGLMIFAYAWRERAHTSPELTRRVERLATVAVFERLRSTVFEIGAEYTHERRCRDIAVDRIAALAGMHHDPRSHTIVIHEPPVAGVAPRTPATGSILGPQIVAGGVTPTGTAGHTSVAMARRERTAHGNPSGVHTHAAHLAFRGRGAAPGDALPDTATQARLATQEYTGG